MEGTTATISSIITDIGSVLEWFLGIFADLFAAVTTNPYLLFPILFGFMILGVSLAVGLVKRLGLLRG